MVPIGREGPMNPLLGTLREGELDLVRETEPERMQRLDEDALLDLHTRVRRARTKYVKLYRREASARVPSVGGRGLARPKRNPRAGSAWNPPLVAGCRP